MSAKSGYSCAVALAVLGSCMARAQEAVTPPAAELANVPAYAAPPAVTAPNGQPPAPAYGQQPAGQSSWIAYVRPDCCGPLGCDGPVVMELFLRNGASFPVGDGVFRDVLDAGWQIEGGGRSLFFNPEMDAAWTVELGILNIANTSSDTDTRIPMTILVPRPTNAAGDINPIINGVPLPAQFQSPPYPQNAAIPVPFGSQGFPGLVIKSLNRTFVNIGGGREWYLWEPANSAGTMWRAGFDVGGRYGTAKANFDIIRHRTDVIGGIYAALHSDVEVPYGCACKFQFGIRGEWDYTWCDILQTNDADLQSINILATMGVRY